MKYQYLLPFSCLFVLSSCGNNNNKENQVSQVDLSPIETTILTDTNSYYHIDFANYGESDESLPIGVFDSGTGGLTVLDALVRFDQNKNNDQSSGTDGIPDFNKEEFIYLADQANMPYGNYHSAGKSDLLREHIIKDVQFLLGKNYYNSSQDHVSQNNKSKVKALVIACNTATAYGQEQVDEFIRITKLDIPVIGVINAGAKGTLENFKKDEDGSIGVFATVGTIASKGYEKTILKLKEELGYTGNLQVYNQGGHGIAEAVDEEPDFLNRSIVSPRKDYRGPSLDSGEFKIDRTLMDVYNFDFDHSKMLCDSKDMDDCQILQINSSDNYVRYHLVTLMEKLRLAKNAQPLKALVLGCTHYPYLKADIKSVLNDLYTYKKDGKFLYQDLMAKEVKIIDPSEYVAKELYEALKEKKRFNATGDIKNSEFYISIPNIHNSNVKIDDKERFTYDYKYGRTAGEIQEYVKVVPFNRTNISDDTIERLKFAIPQTFELISGFNSNNNKTQALKADNKIK